MIYNTLLLVHIISGTTALITGTMNMISKKGNYAHRLIGIVFFYAMITVSLSALIMAVMKPNPFLFVVGVFSFYFAWTGKRYLSLKSLHKGQRPHWADWLFLIIMAVFAFVFLAFAIMQTSTMRIVYAVFGIVSLLMVWQDYRIFKGLITHSNYWLLMHISRIVGSFIASATAFLVVNNTILPPIVAWLLPTVVITPIMRHWISKRRRATQRVQA